MTFRKIIGQIHLWLGLSSGLVVFILGITGCLYAFKDEIQAVSEFDTRISNSYKTQLTPSEIKAIAVKFDKKHVVHSVNYGKMNEAIEITYYQETPETFHASLFVHPSTGKKLHYEIHEYDFFQFILAGHYNLWLPLWLGKPIIATATLIFVLLLISGILLWWPKSKNARQQRFKFKWTKNTGKKRRNYDLHNILGFYASFIALIIALTGLVWGFEWFAKSYYTVLGGNKSLVYFPPQSTNKPTNTCTIDAVYFAIQPEYQNKVCAVEYHFPENNKASIYVFVKRDQGTYFRSDYRYFDQYSGEEISVNQLWGKYSNATKSDKLFRMNYDIHVGAIGGITGKIIAFFISLICASLPISGFLIWYWRRKKKKT